MMIVFVPYRGIYFLYKAKKIKSLEGIRFRPLSGNLLSLPEMNYNTIILKRFRPLSGNLLSLQIRNAEILFSKMQFSSPIGESTFSTREPTKQQKENKLFSSPIGESTFSTAKEISKITGYAVFVPYRGIYFLYSFSILFMTSFVIRFRPLSGNLLSLPIFEKIIEEFGEFSSPIGESTFSTLE